jgi:hypothetical protein
MMNPATTWVIACKIVNTNKETKTNKVIRDTKEIQENRVTNTKEIRDKRVINTKETRDIENSENS